MIKEFFKKRENILIGIIALISIFFVVLGFLFLFFKTSSDNGPRVIPSSIDTIIWKDFNSKLISQKVTYPEYMYISEQEKQNEVGVTLSEFKPEGFLNYFSNQNHVSIYPQGIGDIFIYAKTRETQYASDSNQDFIRTEYLTLDNEVWAVKLVPKETPKNWQPWGFVLIETKIRNKEQKCLSDTSEVLDTLECDPYQDQKIMYLGDVSNNFIKLGYEIIHKNIFK